MSREAGYLFRLAGPSDVARMAAQQPPHNLDWDEVLRLANDEKAIPVLFEAMQTARPSPLSTVQERRLQQLMLSWTARMAYLQQRLEQLLVRYEDAGIRVLLLKGAALATTVYRGFARRPMADLDLLIDRSRAQEAWDIARGAGWVSTFDGRPRMAWRDHHHLPPLDDARATGLGLELHTDLYPRDSPFAFGADALWHDAITLAVAGSTMAVPSDVHMVLHLCTHFAWSHCMTSAAWRTFRDLQTMIEAGRVCWADIVRQARDTRSSSCAYWTFRLGRLLSGIKVPDSVLAELTPPAGERLLRPVERYYRTVLCQPIGWQDRTRVVETTLWRLGIRPVWSGHGSARPWQHNGNFVRHTPTHPRPGFTERLERSPARWRQLFRELRSLAP